MIENYFSNNMKIPEEKLEEFQMESQIQKFIVENLQARQISEEESQQKAETLNRASSHHQEETKDNCSIEFQIKSVDES